MSRRPQPRRRVPADQADECSDRIADLVARRLAEARAFAERGCLAEANRRLIELRTSLVGRSPHESAGLLRGTRVAPRRGGPAIRRRPTSTAPIGERIDFLKATQLSAQAISELAAATAPPNTPCRPEVRSAALEAWEARHRDRIGHWARNVLSDPRAVLTRAPGHHRCKPGASQ